MYFRGLRGFGPWNGGLVFRDGMGVGEGIAKSSEDQMTFSFSPLFSNSIQIQQVQGCLEEPEQWIDGRMKHDIAGLTVQPDLSASVHLVFPPFDQ